jgi:hypothetical protein
MRFVPVQCAQQRSVLLLPRTRELLLRQRTMLINALRELAEVERKFRCSRCGNRDHNHFFVRLSPGSEATQGASDLPKGSSLGGTSTIGVGARM